MIDLSVLAAAASTTGTPTRLNPVRLFLDADIIVQIVMAGLILASIWVWTIILGFSLKIGTVRKRCAAYEDEFWRARDIDAFQGEQGKSDIASARVVNAGLGEWRRSTSRDKVDREGTRQRRLLRCERSSLVVPDCQQRHALAQGPFGVVRRRGV